MPTFWFWLNCRFFVVANFDYSALNFRRWFVASSIILITWLGIARKQQDQFLQSFQFCGKIWVGYYFDWYCCSMSVMGDVCISDVMIWCYFFFWIVNWYWCMIWFWIWMFYSFQGLWCWSQCLALNAEFLKLVTVVKAVIGVLQCSIVQVGICWLWSVLVMCFGIKLAISLGNMVALPIQKGL